MATKQRKHDTIWALTGQLEVTLRELRRMPSTLADVPFIIRQIDVCLSTAKQCHDPEIEGLLLKLARALAARALELGADPKTIPLVELLTAC